MFNSIPIILNLLTNRNIALNYSVTICEQKTKDCARSGSFQHKLQHHCFQLWCLPGFLTSLLYQLRLNIRITAQNIKRRFRKSVHVTKISLFQVSSMLKSLLSAFAHEQISCRVMKISNNNIFSWFLQPYHWNLRLNPCQSLPSVVTNDEKQFQYLNMVLNHETVPWFFEFNRCADTF